MHDPGTNSHSATNVSPATRPSASRDDGPSRLQLLGEDGRLQRLFDDSRLQLLSDDDLLHRLSALLQRSRRTEA